jgi:hypothetical protein
VREAKNTAPTATPSPAASTTPPAPEKKWHFPSYVFGVR